MVSDQTSAPSSKDEIIPVSTAPATGSSGNNYSSSLNADSLQLTVSDVASSSHSYPPNSHGSSVPDHAAGDAVSNNHHSSIDENDIVIA